MIKESLVIHIFRQYHLILELAFFKGPPFYLMRNRDVSAIHHNLNKHNCRSSPSFPKLRYILSVLIKLSGIRLILTMRDKIHKILHFSLKSNRF
jgi:hypothetical protein